MGLLGTRARKWIVGWLQPAPVEPAATKPDPRQAADVAHFRELEKAIYNAYIDVGKTALDRTRMSAEFVEKAAAGIGTAYGAVLGLSFGLSEGATALPPRGVAAAVFLGLALTAAAFHRAFLRAPSEAGGVRDPSPLLPVRSDEDLTAFLLWMRAGSMRRAAALRIAVVHLGLGVAFFPSAFINAPDQAVITVAVALGTIGSMIAYLWK